VHFFNEQGVQLLYRLEFSSKLLGWTSCRVLDALIYWIMDAISSSVDERARWSSMMETANDQEPSVSLFPLHAHAHAHGLPSSKLTMISTSSLNGHDKHYT
jgi:hypothetical protein